jgi:hypothetical protein
VEEPEEVVRDDERAARRERRARERDRRPARAEVLEVDGVAGRGERELRERERVGEVERAVQRDDRLRGVRRAYMGERGAYVDAALADELGRARVLLDELGDPQQAARCVVSAHFAHAPRSRKDGPSESTTNANAAAPAP